VDLSQTISFIIIVCVFIFNPDYIIIISRMILHYAISRILSISGHVRCRLYNPFRLNPIWRLQHSLWVPYMAIDLHKSSKLLATVSLTESAYFAIHYWHMIFNAKETPVEVLVQRIEAVQTEAALCLVYC
jgi:hypothetical protein